MTAQHTRLRVEVVEHIEEGWWNTLVASVGGEFHQTMFYADFCKHCLHKRKGCYTTRRGSLRNLIADKAIST